MIKVAKVAIAAAGILGALQLGDETLFPGMGLISPAHAVVGRPLTPGSVAGVARRTARRTTRRIAHLPAGCHYGLYYGAHYYKCGSHYYEKDGNVYVQIIFQ